LAKTERELLRFLFHEPAWLEQALSKVDLAALGGAPEREIGRALLEALGEGKLPPDLAALQTSNAGDLVAGEVLKRLTDSADGGIIKTAEGAKALCVALAQEPARAAKLKAEERLEALVGDISELGMRIKHGEAARKHVSARLQGDKVAEEQAYMRGVQLRREIKESKRMKGPRDAGTPRGEAR
jgi:hypothetical protein